MSRAAMYVNETSPWILNGMYPSNSVQPTKWIELPDNLKKVASNIAPVFDTRYFYNDAAGTAEIATYEIMEQLAQHLVESMHLTYLPLCRQDELPARMEDIWVEMPPLSIEKVVMRARDMGLGEPLAFLDSLSEE